MKETLMKYGVLYGKRYSSQEKQQFLNSVETELNELGIHVERVKLEEKNARGEHLFINYPEKKKRVFIAGYDTPSESMCRNYKYYPLNHEMIKKYNKEHLWTEAIVVILLLLVSVLGIYFFIQFKQWYRYILLAIAIYFGYCGLRVSKGKSNEVNFNMNSAAVALLIDMIGKSNLDDCGFVLADMTCNTLAGFEGLKNKLKKNSQVILLEGLGEGSKFCSVKFENSKAKRVSSLQELDIVEINTSEKDYSIFHIFPDCELLMLANQDENGYYIPNVGSKLDYKINVDFLERLESALIKNNMEAKL